MTELKQVIIVRRKKKGGHGHHGGAWKVAYADFVTAMMAFFMVMWILGMDESTRKAVEGYFSNPAGFKKGYGSGNSPISSGNTPSKIKSETVKLIMHTAQEKAFAKAANEIKVRLDSAKGAVGNGKFEITMSSKGLRIELIENGSGDNFFGRGSAAMTKTAVIGLQLIAKELIALRNPVVVEGHTDATLYGQNASYTNWELSADRANAARRILEQSGLDPARIIEVRGYADTQLRRPEEPQSAENRRISILLPFTNAGSVATNADVGVGGN